MNKWRDRKVRSVLGAVAVVNVLALAMVGCGTGGEGEDRSPSKENSRGSSASEGEDPKPSATERQVLAQIKGGDVAVTVKSAVRDSGGFLTVSGDVQNTGSGIWLASDWQSDERELKKNGGSLAGATIVDTAAKKKYLVLRDTTGRCLCTKFEGGVDEGKTVDWYAQFPAPPQESEKVELQIGAMPPATIQISEG
ncbi:hypothetical protein [Streptomyces koyangensis]|uniref:DUF4352 domain-containing protein n=1 Tax=Streptomyces koyangensis TaxID=188770 RepID=A0A385DGF8_9ACTN|nr:hypothetical protein [Streptomyces koyangensis]AXQ57040.1 hypothetical protein D0C37_22145 [Streptomyces koyangensis]